MRARVVAIVGWTLLSFCLVEGALAQEQRPTPEDTTDQTTRADTVEQAADQTGPPPPGERPQSPSGPPTASGGTGPPGGSGSDNAVTFSAQDSLVLRRGEEGGDKSTLYGQAEMTYQDATLQAQTVEMDLETNTLEASGSSSETDEETRPSFQQEGGQSFTGSVLSYNLNTRRGRVVTARTQQRDANIQGGTVKMFEDSTLFIQDASYTTCDCPPEEIPSYSLRSNEMKVQGEWVYTGPIQLYLFSVPTPLWLPFGFLPNIQGRRSGPLSPDYGEDRRGFYLRNLGWYFALNDYMDLQIEAGVWSQGSYEIRPRFRYRKRYDYNGRLQVTYRREKVGEELDPNFQKRHEGDFRWRHSQDLSPTASLNGDIDLATSGDFARRNSDDFNDAVRQDVSSSIRYRKRWPEGGRRVNISASQKQKFQNNEVRLRLPNVSFSQNSFKPFEQEQRIGSQRWYEKITTSYDLDVTNTYNFRPRDPEQVRQGGTVEDSLLADSIAQANVDWYEALVDRRKYRLATGDDERYDFQATHQIPLSMSFRVDRFNLSLSPSLNYTSDWYVNTIRQVARDTSSEDGPSTVEVVEQTEPGFYARHDFGSSFSASTELYGMFPVEVGSFEGLRHRMSPSLSANYQPNFNAPFWGRSRVLRTEDGTPVRHVNGSPMIDTTAGDLHRYDIVSGSRVRRSSEQRSLNFSLRNVFETKRVEIDSTGDRRTDKITLLNLDVSGLSYNFAADSFRVGNSINVNARTRINPFNISARTSFSPYALRRGNTDQFRRVDQLMVVESPVTPARLTQFRTSVGVDFSSRDRGRNRTTRARGSRRQSQRRPQRRGAGMQPGQRRASSGANRTGPPSPSEQQDRRAQQARSTELADLSLPWSLGFDFSYRLQKPQKEVTNRSATLDVDFSLNVTPLWRVQGRTGYDFLQKKISTTRIRINRNLGCWNMSFTWVPFGEFQKYGFNLQVSSGQLSQLLQLQIPNKGGEGRLGGFGNQLQGTVQGAAGAAGGLRGQGGGVR